MKVLITLLAHGCPPQAIVAAFGLGERTVQTDELRVKRQGSIVWMALTLQVSTCLWLGGVVATERILTLIVALTERVRASDRRMSTTAVGLTVSGTSIHSMSRAG